jgi:ketosteroid isomerase-like protein
MTAHADLIDRFYEAFAAKDAAVMSACYHPDVRFTDPVFADLRGHEAAAMWHMLTEQGADLRIEYSDVLATGDVGSAHWDAWYTFTGGRPVENRIDAVFTFKDGRIATHKDTFDLYAWSKQALGLPGLLLGWTPFLQNQVRAQANKSLRRFIVKRGLGAELIPPVSAS